jgi:hypothetical protein
MPRYFAQTKYKSFTRQLNIYGFQRIIDRESLDFGAYHNKCFVRDQQELCRYITCQRIKGTGEKRGGHKTAIPPSQKQQCTSSIFQGSSEIPTTPLRSSDDFGSLRKKVTESRLVKDEDHTDLLSSDENEFLAGIVLDHNLWAWLDARNLCGTRLDDVSSSFDPAID